MKAAMELIDRPLGDPYPPFPALTAVEKKALGEELKKTSLFRRD
jgi:hypothetical protein